MLTLKVREVKKSKKKKEKKSRLSLNSTQLKLKLFRIKKNKLFFIKTHSLVFLVGSDLNTTNFTFANEKKKQKPPSTVVFM